MFILCCSLQTFEFWLAIAADLATAFGMFGILGAVLLLLKNTVTKRHLKFEYKQIRSDYFELTFINYTNKEFSIISISLLINGQEFFAEELDYISNNRISFVDKKHIEIYPYQSQSFFCNFKIKNMQLSQKLIFKVKTTARQKSLIYKFK